MRVVIGKVVVITGSAMGMGRELAELFLRDGAKVVAWDLNEDALNKTVAELKKINDTIYPYVIDITSREKVFETAERVEKEVGPVAVLVNNAGIVAGGDFVEVPIEKHIKVIDVNLNALMTCTYAFLPKMMERGDGHIINMASAAGLMGVPLMASYCASKFAVVGFSESLRLELIKRRYPQIKITIVCPSIVTTGMFEGFKPPLLSPPLTPKQMAEKIYVGFKKDKVYVKEPFMVKMIPLMKAISTPDSFARAAELSGVMTAMDSYVGREKR